MVKEFVGLKPKMHSMKLIDNHECRRAKGVNIALDFDEFKDVLFNKITVRHKMRGIQDKKHEIGTYEIKKTFLSCFHDKRLVDDDGIHLRAYFRWKNFKS